MIAEQRPSSSPDAVTGSRLRFRSGEWFKSNLGRHEVKLRAIPYGFAALIAVGTMLLALPISHNPGMSVSLLDALFLSTSASCVTGLTTINVATDFNFFGQLVLLLLIQLGGLGIMTAGTFFVLLTGSRLSLAHEKSIAGTVGTLRSARPGDIFIYACVFVLLFELAGTVAMLPTIAEAFPDQSVGESLWQAVFHSVSAFCNAGISLFPEGLIRWRDSPWLLSVVDVLVIGGGIGLLTLVNLRYFYWWRKDTRQRGRLNVQTKLSLVLALILLLIGTVFTLALEWNHSLASAGSWVEKCSWAFFHSAMTRTAGFNVVDTGQMHPATLQVTMALMFIGGAPGSMAGGIKTITAAVLMLAAWSALRRRGDVTLFSRRVPRDQVAAAVMIVLLASICLLVAVTLLMITESGHAASQTYHRWMALAFESVSAFGTVGLSTGITPLLTWVGKLIIVALMFVGRVGPLMLAMHLGRPVWPWHVRYPEESVSLG